MDPETLQTAEIRTVKKTKWVLFQASNHAGLLGGYLTNVFCFSIRLSALRKKSCLLPSPAFTLEYISRAGRTRHGQQSPQSSQLWSHWSHSSLPLYCLGSHDGPAAAAPPGGHASTCTSGWSQQAKESEETAIWISGSRQWPRSLSPMLAAFSFYRSGPWHCPSIHSDQWHLGSHSQQQINQKCSCHLYSITSVLLRSRHNWVKRLHTLWK